MMEVCRFFVLSNDLVTLYSKYNMVHSDLPMMEDGHALNHNALPKSGCELDMF